MIRYRLEGQVNKKGDIFCDGRFFNANNIGLNAEWQGIMCSRPVYKFAGPWCAER
jgi:hypothetical protein